MAAMRPLTAPLPLPYPTTPRARRNAISWDSLSFSGVSRKVWLGRVLGTCMGVCALVFIVVDVKPTSLSLGTRLGPSPTPALVFGQVSTTRGVRGLGNPNHIPSHVEPRRIFRQKWAGGVSGRSFFAPARARAAPQAGNTDADVIVIGSGIGGLSCAGLLARYGYKVLVLESHYYAGGAAHGFERKGFKFDTGPSLYAGMSQPSVNPLRQVLDAVGEEVEWDTYTSWGMHTPDGNFTFNVGPDDFRKVLGKFGGSEAVVEWDKLMKKIGPLHESSSSLPPLVMRADLNALRTTFRYLPSLLKPGPATAQVAGPLDGILRGTVTNKFLYNWLNFLAFALCGLPAYGTTAAAVIYMLGEMHKEGAVLDAPRGGGKVIVDALVRGIQKNGGDVRLRTHVQDIIVGTDNKAKGVRLSSGEEIYASKAIVSNAPLWNTAELLKNQTKHSYGARSFVEYANSVEPTKSIAHLHLGIEGSGLDLKSLEPHQVIVNDWNKPIDDPQNLIVISIPTILDPSLAPPGHHVIHAYLAGNEPFDIYDKPGMTKSEYEDLKEQRVEVLWKALELSIPDIKQRVVKGLNMTGSPLTHARYLRRYKGAYGPNLPAGEKPYPGPKTEIEGFFRCGDSCFPGVGVPAVAASGINAANSIADISQHLQLLEQMRREGVYDDSLTKPKQAPATGG